MNNLFSDITMQQTIEEHGYILLPRFLPPDTVKQLRDLYAETLQPVSKSGLYESTGANDISLNNLIHISIQNLLFPLAEGLFRNYTLYGGAFLVKSPNDSTELPLHQDWSFVDEDEHRALFFWMPLQPVNRENGTIYLIDRSHRFFRLFRSGAYNSNRIPRQLIPHRFIRTISIVPGDVLIYSPALFHGSYKNSTPNERVVATALLTDKNAPFQYIHKKDKKNAEQFRITPESYLNDINYLSKGKVPPGAEFIRTFPYRHIKISAWQLNKQLTGNSFPIRDYLKNLI